MHIEYEFMLINDAFQSYISIRVRLKVTQEKGRNMQRCHQRRIKTNVVSAVSVLFLFDYLLYDCPKLYIFVNDTQQDSFYKIQVHVSVLPPGK
jgi:hypothetical protein